MANKQATRTHLDLTEQAFGANVAGGRAADM
jgi:hypothetical protein